MEKWTDPLGLLLPDVAHEIRNLMQIVQGLAAIARAHPSAIDRFTQLLTHASHGQLPASSCDSTAMGHGKRGRGGGVGMAVGWPKARRGGVPGPPAPSPPAMFINLPNPPAPSPPVP